MQEHSINSSLSQKPSPEIPPCCGTGCAVCVLDMVDDYAPLAPAFTPAPQNDLPACCNTGCLICVQDYPELYRNGRPDQTQMIALLEAVETAETIAAQN
jgi:hypothetical protein